MSGRWPAQRGRLITFEGGEGVGKSTQVRRLAERLRGRGLEVVATREPGGSPKAERLRALLLSGAAAQYGALGEAILFTAARIDHIDTLIKPALTRGAFVLSDRFADSTTAYQGALGKADPRLLQLLERIALGPLRPDLTIVLDLPFSEGMARAARRRGVQSTPDRFEREDDAFHEKLRHAFLEIAAKDPARCVAIDASQSEEEVAEAVWRIVEARFLAQRVMQATGTE